MTMMSILNASRLRTKGKKYYVLHECTTVPAVASAKTENKKKQTTNNLFQVFLVHTAQSLSGCVELKFTDGIEILHISGVLTLNFSPKYSHICYSLRFCLQFKFSSVEKLQCLAKQ